MQEHERHQFETWVRKISWRGEMAPHSSILAGRILWIEVLGGSSVPGGLKVVRHNWASEYNRFSEFNLGKFIFRFSKVWLNVHQKTALLQPNQKPPHSSS